MNAKEQSGIEIIREYLESDNQGFRKRKICILEVLQKKRFLILHIIKASIEH